MSRPAKLPSTPREPGTFIVLPRAWFVGLVLLVVLPWLVTWAISSRAPAPPEPAAPRGTPVVSAEGKATGPWGELSVAPIVISPPLEYVPRELEPSGLSSWHFPNITREELDGFLRAAGISPDAVSRLVASARPLAQINGFVVPAHPDIVQAMSAETRANLYLRLARYPQNFDQYSAYRFEGTSLDAWLPSPRIAPEVKRLVEPLVYRHKGFMFFADIELVRGIIQDPAEIQRLAKGLLRQSTVLASLRLTDPSQVPAIAEYWGRGGRRTDIRPLLESVADSGGATTTDVSHLLPILAREHLYRYPRVTAADLARPVLANCFWTALNFFSTRPDDRFLDVNFAMERLRQDYFIVEGDFQLGDVVAFLDGEGNLIHVAVYLAADLVFGKNGASPLAPWSILPIDSLRGHYVEHSDNWKMLVHRRKDL